MSDFGTFHIDRGLFAHHAFRNGPFDERLAWAWMIGAALEKPKRKRIGNAVMNLERGQFAYSHRFLAHRWRWTVSQVQRFLDRLQAEAMITVTAIDGVTCVSIVNYDKYQVTGLVTESNVTGLVTESTVTGSSVTESTVTGSSVTESIVAECRVNESHLSQQQSAASHCDDNKNDSAKSGAPPPNESESNQISRDNPSYSEPIGGGDGKTRAREALISDQAIELAGDVMRILGIDPEFTPPGWCGAAMWLQMGLASGWRPEVVRVAVARIRARKNYQPPFSYRYLLNPIRREHELMAAPSLPLPPMIVSSEDAHAKTATDQAGDWRARRDDKHAALAELRSFVERSRDRRSGRSEPPLRVVPDVRGRG